MRVIVRLVLVYDVALFDYDACVALFVLLLRLLHAEYCVCMCVWFCMLCLISYVRYLFDAVCMVVWRSCV